MIPLDDDFLGRCLVSCRRCRRCVCGTDLNRNGDAESCNDGARRDRALCCDVSRGALQAPA